jgi:hypothetical protein
MISAKTYLRTICESTGIALKEHKDAGSFTNIAKSKIEKYYSLSMGVYSGVGQNQEALEMSVPIEVRIFEKGFKNLSDAEDSLIARAEEIILEAQQISNKNAQTTSVKDCRFDSFSIEDIGPDNDNLLVGVIAFTIIVFKNPNT